MLAPTSHRRTEPEARQSEGELVLEPRDTPWVDEGANSPGDHRTCRCHTVCALRTHGLGLMPGGGALKHAELGAMNLVWSYPIPESVKYLFAAINSMG